MQTPAGPVLVLDGDQRSALATVRSLGGHGLDVHVAGTDGHGLALRSRYARARLSVPEPLQQPAAYLDTIASYVARNGIETLLPMAEVSSQIVLEARDRLGGVRLAMPPIDRFRAACDKALVAETGRRCGVPVADWVVAEAGDDTPRGFDCFGAPVVLKPTRSRIFSGGRWHGTRVCIADSPAEFQRLVREEPGLALGPFVVQRFVPGNGAGVFFAYDHGRCVATFAHRRLREKPPAGGVSVVSESATPAPEHVEYGRRLLDALEWHGVAMVEFRVDPEGTPWLIEINPRLWGSVQLAIDAGVDFPWLAWQIANGCALTHDGQYAVGTRLRWLLGDLDHMLIRVRSARGWRERMNAVATFLTPVANSRHEVDRLEDPLPAAYELLDWLRSLAGRPTPAP